MYTAVELETDQHLVMRCLSISSARLEIEERLWAAALPSCITPILDQLLTRPVLPIATYYTRAVPQKLHAPAVPHLPCTVRVPTFATRPFTPCEPSPDRDPHGSAGGSDDEPAA